MRRREGRARLIDRHCFSSEDLPSTYHLAFSVKGEELAYRPGDSLSIYPKNREEDVEKTLQALCLRGREQVHFSPRGQGSRMLSLRELLKQYVSLLHTPPSLLAGEKVESPLWHTLNSSLLQHHSLDEICSQFFSLRPRLYSISSSPQEHRREIHLLIAQKRWMYGGEEIRGVCSHYLTEELPYEEEMQFSLHPTRSFLLPSPSIPIIMIGAGTGIAPYRSFMYQRRKEKGANWLIFGTPHQKSHFYYRSFWETLNRSGKLKSSYAFSRDQPEKRYVQHCIRKEEEEFWLWMKEGAVIYLCGDAKRMAREVEATLLTLICERENCSTARSREYLQALRRKRRYLLDVY